jgi:hypothetical protein
VETEGCAIDAADKTVVSRIPGILCDAVGPGAMDGGGRLGFYAGGIVDVAAEVDCGGDSVRGSGDGDGALGSGGEGGVGWAWLEGLETSGGIEDDAEVSCEGRSDGSWPCLWVNLPQVRLLINEETAERRNKGWNGERRERET